MFRLIDMATGEICDQGGNEAACDKARASVICPGARAEMPHLQLRPVAESLATARGVKPDAARYATLHLFGERWEDAEVPPLQVTLQATRGEFQC